MCRASAAHSPANRRHMTHSGSQYPKIPPIIMYGMTKVKTNRMMVPTTGVCEILCRCGTSSAYSSTKPIRPMRPIAFGFRSQSGVMTRPLIQPATITRLRGSSNAVGAIAAVIAMVVLRWPNKPLKFGIGEHLGEPLYWLQEHLAQAVSQMLKSYFQV